MASDDSKNKTISPNTILSPGPETLSPADKIAIHELIARNYLVEDTRDAAHLDAIITEDFEQQHPLFGTTKGRDGLAALLHDNPGLFDGIRHQALNISATGTGENTAEAVHYILVTQVHAIGQTPPVPLPRIIGHGVVRDWLVKHNGQWLVRRRVYDQMAVASDLLPAEQREIAAKRLDPDWTE